MTFNKQTKTKRYITFAIVPTVGDLWCN
jgi:hypothetical protein